MKLEKSDINSDYARWLKSYKRDLRYKDVSKNTLILYNRILNALEEFIKNQNEITKLSEIDKEFFLDFIETQEENSKNGSFAKKTKQLYVSVLKSFFVYISDNNDEFYTFENEFKMPIKGATKSKKVKYLSDKEVEKIVNYLQDRVKSKGLYYDYIYSLGIKLMLFGGLRISEVLQLKLENISLSQLEDENGVQDMYEIELKETKSGEEQTALIKIIDIEDEIIFFKNIREKDEDIFISKKNGNRIDRSNYYIGAKNIMKKAGVDKKGLHIYRHTCAMQLYRKSKDILVTKEKLRHSDIKTTMIYAKAEKSDIAKAMR
ncbi:Integrase [hydrothermal vent metagenome]|uniref:Integrase n=1 Tax=hydrothermal vent metagenome TaxID=652676 RepID=A0A1W1EHR3_9ZZZZ